VWAEKCCLLIISPHSSSIDKPLAVTVLSDYCWSDSPSGCCRYCSNCSRQTHRQYCPQQPLTPHQADSSDPIASTVSSFRQHRKPPFLRIFSLVDMPEHRGNCKYQQPETVIVRNQIRDYRWEIFALSGLFSGIPKCQAKAAR